MTDEDTKPEETWQERRWKELRWLMFSFLFGAIGWPLWSDIKDRFAPAHPAPVSIEADGKDYLACNTPDIGRGIFHSTYYADFKDGNGSTISLRGINKLVVINLPQMVDAPMPVFRSMPYPIPDAAYGTDRDGQPYKEGLIYRWADGSAAMYKNRQWVAVPGLPPVTPAMENQIITLKEDDRVRIGGSAQVKNGKWASTKVRNDVCDHETE